MGVAPKLWLVRHGETECNRAGILMSCTDPPMSATGEKQAAGIGRLLGASPFDLAFTSPLERALRTCEITGITARVEPNLVEWQYGIYEGREEKDVLRERPNWSLFRDGAPGGENLRQVTMRAEAVLKAVAQAEGNVVLVGHKHILRIIAARWLKLPARAAEQFVLNTASVSILGRSGKTPVIVKWNMIHAEYGFRFAQAEFADENALVAAR